MSQHSGLRAGWAERVLTGSVIPVAEAGYANTAGGTLKEQSLLGTVRLEQHWEAADCEGDIRAECTMAPVRGGWRRGDGRSPTHRPLPPVSS